MARDSHQVRSTACRGQCSEDKGERASGTSVTATKQAHRSRPNVLRTAWRSSQASVPSRALQQRQTQTMRYSPRLSPCPTVRPWSTDWCAAESHRSPSPIRTARQLPTASRRVRLHSQYRRAKPSTKSPAPSTASPSNARPCHQVVSPQGQRTVARPTGNTDASPHRAQSQLFHTPPAPNQNRNWASAVGFPNLVSSDIAGRLGGFTWVRQSWFRPCRSCSRWGLSLLATLPLMSPSLLLEPFAVRSLSVAVVPVVGDIAQSPLDDPPGV